MEHASAHMWDTPPPAHRAGTCSNIVICLTFAFVCVFLHALVMEEQLTSVKFNQLINQLLFQMNVRDCQWCLIQRSSQFF